MAESNTERDPIITPSFPTGRIKKIIKLDKEISKINAEALFLVSCSADLFLSFLSELSAVSAVDNNRKSVRLQHLRSAVRSHRPTSDFLLDSLPNPVLPPQHQTKEKKAKVEEEEELPRGTQKIDRFFTKGVV